jgi:hypothetical protein
VQGFFRSNPLFYVGSLKMKYFFLVIVLCVAGKAIAADQKALIDQHPGPTPSIVSEPVLELFVTLDDKIDVGLTDDGHRYIVPITGGHFLGRDISGKVLPFGADWQVIRTDGSKSITAVYAIQTDDGTRIVVDNTGIVSGSGETRYARTRPVFHAPEGKYQWLNESLFVGTITSVPSAAAMPASRAVVIRVYQVL